MIEFEETTLHCTATGNPMPKIKWVKDGKTVGTGISLILKTSRNETGEYWCWADNGLGKSIKAGSYLDVQCKCERLYAYTTTINSKKLFYLIRRSTTEGLQLPTPYKRLQNERQTN